MVIWGADIRRSGYARLYRKHWHTMLIPIDAPTQVRNAFLLLWASLALTTIDSAIALIAPEFIDPELSYLFWWWIALSFVLIGANAYLIYCASRQRNWARIVLLVVLLSIVALNLAIRFIFPTEWSSNDFWSDATAWACSAMDALALYWLFSGAAARWYAEKAGHLTA